MKWKINILRGQIDKIDSKIVKLIDERLSVSIEIMKLKNEHGIPLHDPDREAEVIQRAVEETTLLPADEIQLIYRTILNTTRKYLKKRYLF
ncbi:MAG: chorismate mutase [Deferribacteraceae bacterium]|jgi:chorismate mutase|nr:chorismate mutase [Deferribacteraceae bacterium]